MVVCSKQVVERLGRLRAFYWRRPGIIYSITDLHYEMKQQQQHRSNRDQRHFSRVYRLFSLLKSRLRRLTAATQQCRVQSTLLFSTAVPKAYLPACLPAATSNITTKRLTFDALISRKKLSIAKFPSSSTSSSSSLFFYFTSNVLGPSFFSLVNCLGESSPFPQYHGEKKYNRFTPINQWSVECIEAISMISFPFVTRVHRYGHQPLKRLLRQIISQLKFTSYISFYFSCF